MTAANPGNHGPFEGQFTRTADGMVIDFDVPILMDDGLTLRADVYRPMGSGRYPVIMTMGPYAKGLAVQDGWTFNWTKAVTEWPEIEQGSSNKYQTWETVDPERWVPDGYVCIRVDSRGAGRSPGYLDPWSDREARDFYTCIEWAAEEPWSSGKVGLAGISYYAMNQWHVAALRPPHLAAMIVQEGAADFYRDFARHGGIRSEFVDVWYRNLYETVQHGATAAEYRSRVTGQSVTGPDELNSAELERNRRDLVGELREREFVDHFYFERTANLEAIVTPLLSCGNWGGQGLHPRGNTEGFLRAGSDHKWLEMHGDTHTSPFYTDHGVRMQKEFFSCFLKGDSDSWMSRPRVMLRVRQVDGSLVDRGEHEWPLQRTVWTKLHLDPTALTLAENRSAPGAVSFDATGDGIRFLSAPMVDDTEITGPLAAHLTVSSSTTDADVFLCVAAIDPNGHEVTFQGSNDPRTPLALGWLRASHRKTDESASAPYRPWHSHDERQPLQPGIPVGLDIEIWPTCIVLPAGYRLALTVRGRDYDNGSETDPGARYPLRGVGPFTHRDPIDRPETVFGGVTTVHSTENDPAYLLIPVIPAGEPVA